MVRKTIEPQIKELAEIYVRELQRAPLSVQLMKYSEEYNKKFEPNLSKVDKETARRFQFLL